MSKKSGKIIVEALGEAGVKRCYGNVEDTLNQIWDPIRACGHIEWVHVRHEETGDSPPVPKLRSQSDSRHAPAPMDQTARISSTVYSEAIATAHRSL